MLIGVIKSLKEHTILIILLMIYKRYLLLINIVESRGLFNSFLFVYENDKI
jgi:hypothetical protein